jgi:hypothetical protein
MQNVGAVEYNIGYNERKWLTMANLYTIEDLLIGKSYRSNSLTGEIVSAEKSKNALWYGDNTEAYFVEIDEGRINNTYRTVVVKVGE